jgi:hypothetical protein
MHIDTQSPGMRLINVKWTRAHKLAMFWMHAQTGNFEDMMTNQILYLQARDEEAEIWASMTTSEYIDYQEMIAIPIEGKGL